VCAGEKVLFTPSSSELKADTSYHEAGFEGLRLGANYRLMIKLLQLRGVRGVAIMVMMGIVACVRQVALRGYRSLKT